LSPDDGGDTFLLNVSYNKSHRVTYQKMAFFIVTAVEISDLAI
jgi:hypothetical protein